MKTSGPDPPEVAIFERGIAGWEHTLPELLRPNVRALNKYLQLSCMPTCLSHAFSALTFLSAQQVSDAWGMWHMTNVYCGVRGWMDDCMNE